MYLVIDKFLYQYADTLQFRTHLKAEQNDFRSQSTKKARCFQLGYVLARHGQHQSYLLVTPIKSSLLNRKPAKSFFIVGMYYYQAAINQAWLARLMPINSNSIHRPKILSSTRQYSRSSITHLNYNYNPRVYP
jgi:hypothetical protein